MSLVEFDNKPEVSKSAVASGCLHNYIKYQGLVEKYQYCTKCDDKKDYYS